MPAVRVGRKFAAELQALPSPVRPSRGGRDVLIRSFEQLPDAIEYTLSALAARRRSFLIAFHWERPRSRDADPIELQVLDQNTVFHDGQFGLVVELCFPASGLSASSGRFDRFPVRDQFVEVGGRDRRFVARVGFDASAATELLSRVLIDICRSDTTTALTCTVFDRTPVD